jgi:hypothetical protein
MSWLRVNFIEISSSFEDRSWVNLFKRFIIFELAGTEFVLKKLCDLVWRFLTYDYLYLFLFCELAER